MATPSRCTSRSPRSTRRSGDIGGNAAKIAELHRPRPRRGRRPGGLPRAGPDRLSAGGPAAEDRTSSAAAGAALEELAAQTQRHRRAGRLPRAARTTSTTPPPCWPTARCAAVYRKIYLPNYGVFDEQRYFQAGDEPALVELNGVTLGITICEDIWEPGPPASTEALAGAEVIVNLSASPYHAGKGLERERMLVQRARDSVACVLFCNAVGGQDELVFDGHSVAIDQDGELLARAPQFEEALVHCAVDPSAVVRRAAARPAPPRRRAGRARARRPQRAPARRRSSCAGGRQRPRGRRRARPLMAPEEEVYAALRTGLRDYVDKNGFERVVLALSGGIDCALVALVAVDALGPERVTCVSMPSPYSSEGTRGDARAIAENLGVDFMEIGIEDAMRAYDAALEDAFAGREADIAEENIQARIRGNVVMALSNKFGWLVLTTGNKSELSVGYATLYGDMAGGFAVLKDVFKGWVYRLVRWRNERRERARAACPPACSSGRRRPSCAPTSATRTRCPPTTCSTRSSPATSSRTSTPPSWWPRACPPRRSSG